MLDLRLDVVACPGCGSEVEIFTDEYEARCRSCGRAVRREIASCIDYCRNARRCLEEWQSRRAKAQGSEPLG